MRFSASAVGYRLFGAGSGFLGGWLAAGGGVFANFRDFFAGVGGDFILAGGLGTGLSVGTFLMFS